MPGSTRPAPLSPKQGALVIDQAQSALFVLHSLSIVGSMKFVKGAIRLCLARLLETEAGEHKT